MGLNWGFPKGMRQAMGVRGHAPPDNVLIANGAF